MRFPPRVIDCLFRLRFLACRMRNRHFDERHSSGSWRLHTCLDFSPSRLLYIIESDSCKLNLEMQLRHPGIFFLHRCAQLNCTWSLENCSAYSASAESIPTQFQVFDFHRCHWFIICQPPTSSWWAWRVCSTILTAVSILKVLQLHDYRSANSSHTWAISRKNFAILFWKAHPKLIWYFLRRHTSYPQNTIFAIPEHWVIIQGLHLVTCITAIVLGHF